MQGPGYWGEGYYNLSYFADRYWYELAAQVIRDVARGLSGPVVRTVRYLNYKFVR